jgi:hypothetical protein
MRTTQQIVNSEQRSKEKMMIQVKDRWHWMAVTPAGRASAAGGVTVQRTRTGGRLVRIVPFWWRSLP